MSTGKAYGQRGMCRCKRCGAISTSSQMHQNSSGNKGATEWGTVASITLCRDTLSSGVL